MIPVGWLDPSQDCWDSNLIRNLTSNTLYPTGLRFRHHTGFPPPHMAEGTILIIPGRYYSDQTDEITTALDSYRWVLGIVTSDEESLFHIADIGHPNIKWWQQTPRHGRSYGDARLFGVGFPPAFNELPKEPPEKKTGVFLAGQKTHARRTECFDALYGMKHVNKDVWATEGFTQGLPPADYVEGMLEGVVAPCPSGAVSPDTFRAWEALEAHAIPILDAVSPVDGPTQYWEQVLPGCPAPLLTDYASLPGYISDSLEQWPANANRITAWWMQTKRRYSQWLREDLQALGVTL